MMGTDLIVLLELQKRGTEQELKITTHVFEAGTWRSFIVPLTVKLFQNFDARYFFPGDRRFSLR